MVWNWPRDRSRLDVMRQMEADCLLFALVLPVVILNPLRLQPGAELKLRFPLEPRDLPAVRGCRRVLMFGTVPSPGLRLISDLARQMQGQLTYALGRGINFSVTFKIARCAPVGTP